MCLAIPKKVIFIKKNGVEVCANNSEKTEKVRTILKVKKGDWVLTQNKIIVNKITKKQAEEINKIIKNL